MSLFSNKMKHGIVMLLVFAMMLQIVGPTVYAYADSVESEDFRITITDFVDFQEDNTATALADWEFYYDSSTVLDEYIIEDLPFWLNETVTGDIVSDDDVFIGTFTAEGSQITVELSKKFKEAYAPEEVPSGLPSEENSDEENLGTADTPDGVGTPTPDDNKTPEDDGTLDDDTILGGEGTLTPDDKTLGGGQATEEGNQTQGEDDNNQSVSPEGKSDDSTGPKEEGTPVTNPEPESLVSKAIGKAILFTASTGGDLGGYGEAVREKFTGNFKIEGVTVPPSSSKIATPFGGVPGKKLTSEKLNINNFQLFFGTDVVVGTAAEYLIELGVDELNQQLALSFNFSLLEKHDTNPGDYYEFDVPTAFKLEAKSGTIISKNGEETLTVATYDISSTGRVRITFAEDIADGTPVNNGKFEMSWALGAEFSSGDLEKEYTFDINGEKTIRFRIKNDIQEPSLNKKNSTHTKNAAAVTWTVDVNKAMDNIGGQTLTDTMANQVIADTVRVYQLVPSLDDGKIIWTEQEINKDDYINHFNVTEDTFFPINFIGETNTKAYKYVYDTTITEEDREAALSGSHLISNSVSINGKTDSGKSTLNFDKPITKSNSIKQDKDGAEITWTVEVNADNRDISGGVTVTDTLTLVNASSIDGKLMEFIKAESLVKVDIDPAPKEGTKLVTLVGSAESGYTLKIEFTPADNQKTAKHTITYKTKDEVVDKNYTVNNDVEISYNNSYKKYSDNSSAVITHGMISKSASSIDYEDKKINWSFTFNGRGYDSISEVEFKDTFEAGKYLKMYAEDFINENKDKLSSPQGNAGGNGFILELDTPKSDGDGKSYTTTGFTLKLATVGTINGSITFNYPTYFDPTQSYSNNNVRNDIEVKWKKYNTTYKNNDEGIAEFNPYTADNGDKVGTYYASDKRVDWHVDINYNKHHLESAHVIDKFGPKLTMDEISKETIKVFLLDLSKGTPEKAKNVGSFEYYNVEPIDGETADYTGFRLTFLDVENKPYAITQPYRIEYTTKFNDEFIGDLDGTKKNQVKNTAELYNKNSEFGKPLEKIVTIPNAGKYFRKDGKDINRKDYLEWILVVNESQSYIKAGSTIEDTLNDGQVLVEDFTGLDLQGVTLGRGTFEIKKRVYTDSNNTGTLSAPLFKEDIEALFDIDISEDKKSFKITFSEDINHEYVISYVTDISASIEKSLSNTYEYKFSGKGLETGSDTISKDVTYQMADGQGEIPFYNVKLNKKDGSKPLENVQFTLYKGESIVKEARSGADGIVDFGTIKWGTYTLKETGPADGYNNYFEVKGSNGTNGKFVDTYNLDAKGSNVNITYDIDNKAPGTITIDKFDKETNLKLADAEFEIIKDGQVVGTVITDGEGKATLSNLPPGTYTLSEIIAPDGYAKEKIEGVILTSKGDITVQVPNEKLNQAVKLIKTDKDTEDVLSGVEFELYDSNGVRVTTNFKDEPLGELVTDSKGEIVINNLAQGTYYFKEVKGPKYYILPVNTDTDPFTIKENQKIPSIVELENTRGVGKIIISKVDFNDKNVLIDGVEFKLSGVYNSIVRIGITENGVVEFDNLPYGEYTLVETKAHPDYVIELTPITIELNDENGENSKEVTKEVKNTKKDHSVRLTKYNSNKSRTLAGAVFELRKLVGDKYEVINIFTVEQLTTDENGEIYLENLEPGEYQFVEVRAPRGYDRNRTPVEFTIVEDQITTVEVEKTNRRTSDPDPDPEKPEKPEKEDPGKPGEEENPGKPEEDPDPETPGPGPEPETPDPGPETPGPETPGPEPTPEPGPETPGTERPPVEETTEPEKPVEVTPPDIPEGSTPEVKEPPKNGTVTFDENGKWIYTPNPGFTGEDTFIITITHPNGTTEDILITVNVAVPKGNVLPKTGELNPILFYIAGVMMIGLGVVLRRRTIKG